MVSKPTEYEPKKRKNVAPAANSDPSKLNSKTRRSYSRLSSNYRNKHKQLTLIGTNSAGLNSKRESLFHLVNTLNPSVITIQETKFNHYRTLKIPDYEIFEQLRGDKMGGGLFTAILVKLNPHLISTSCDVELLVVQFQIGNLHIRIINGYGPQEDDSVEKINFFWKTLESEINCAKEEGCSVIVQMDANAKIGSELLVGDPNPTSNNGRKLIDLVNRMGLHIGNVNTKCVGTITRERQTNNKVEKSVLDYYIFCDTLINFLEEMIIDENRKWVLKNTSKNKGKNLILSDHNILLCRLSINIPLKSVSSRKEFFNFKDPDHKLKFCEETSCSTNLSECFNQSADFDNSCNKFFKLLNKKLHKCFTKIRSRKGGRKQVGNPVIQLLLKTQSDVRSISRKVSCQSSLILIAQFEEKIEMHLTKLQHEENAAKLKEKLLLCGMNEDKFNQQGFWKIRKQCCPKSIDPPMAKRDNLGNLVTASEALKSLYLQTYINRLSHRPMKPELIEIFQSKTNLWNSRLNRIQKVTTCNWDFKCLENVLTKLKNNKSIDPNGMCNEIFKPGCIGSDLQLALLKLFNQCKLNQKIPPFMCLSNITSIHKNKGSRLLLENDRGIFIQTALKKILDKLIYNDVFKEIDLRMSDSNIGARKKRNIKDHLFVLYSVINAVLKGEDDCIDIQAYDIQKCFDSLWMDDCFNDIFDILPECKRTEKISLLYYSNISNLVAVKTPAGLSERVDMPSIIQQGGVWGSILCSNTVDTLGRKCKTRGNHIYMYKNRVEVLPLGFVDDLTGVAKCGTESKNLNIFINTQIEMKKLTFHTAANPSENSKCVRMHVGRSQSSCPPLKVHDKNMSNVSKITYLGDIISSDGRNTLNIQDRVKKGIAIVIQIMKIFNSIRMSNYTIEITLLLRESLLINGMLTNAEIWFHVQSSETESLSKIDRSLFHKIFRVPQTLAAPALYLETGILPVSTIVKVRRLIYFHSVLTGKKDGMLYKVFFVQWHYPSKGDWTIQIKTDLTDLNLPCDLEKIAKYPTDSFKTLVKVRAKIYAFNLLSKKKEGYKKLENLQYTELSIQNYLVDTELDHEEKIVLFLFRTRMVNVGENFRSGRDFTLCPLCGLHLDSQFLILQCPELKSELVKRFGSDHATSISEVFSKNIDKKLAETLKYAMDIRKSKLAS